MEIREIEPRDEAAFADWYGVVDAVALDERPGEPHWFLEELRQEGLRGRPGDDGTPPRIEALEHVLALDGGRPVGAARLSLPLRDNQHLAYLELWVLPTERRRGVGSALLAELAARAKAAERHVLMALVDEPPAVEGRSAGRAFALAHGFSPALREVRRDLDLPADPARLDEIDAECRPHADGYAIRTWQDRCPDDLVDDRARLGQTMSTDVPLGDLDYREEKWDAERVRHQEEMFAAQGRSYLAAGAVHEASGRLVAFTEIGVPLVNPTRVYQWDTLVVGEHRGHRLGTLVKTACLRQLAERFPAARVISTWNAASNAPMIAVNERLGFRTNGSDTEWQRVD